MDEKKVVAKLSRVGILGNVILSAFKQFAGIFGHSGAMISDAVHSLSDVFATLIAYIGVVLSKQEADKEHPYGHERFECIASLILGMILAATGLGIGYSGIKTLLKARAGTAEIAIPTLLPLIAAIVSVLVKEGMYFRRPDGRCMAPPLRCIFFCRFFYWYWSRKAGLSDYGSSCQPYNLSLYS